jgi:hypothetical protein
MPMFSSRRSTAVLLSTLWLALAPGPALAAGPDPGPPAQRGMVGQLWDTVTDEQAWTGEGHWRMVFAPTAAHFRYSEEHRHVWAIGVERERADHWLAGLSYFTNSFGQPSAYAYVGRRFNGVLDSLPQLYAQGSAGVLYGYKGKYKNKVPLNVGGFSPGALIGLGWQFTPSAGAALHLLGDAGVMLQFGWDFR